MTPQQLNFEVDLQSDQRWCSEYYLYKYSMRAIEITGEAIAAQQPMTPEKARINALKQTVKRSHEYLRQERERQRRQKEVERRRRDLQSGAGLV